MDSSLAMVESVSAKEVPVGEAAADSTSLNAISILGKLYYLFPIK